MMWLLDWCAVVAWLKTLDYGDVPTWFSSIGGIGALIAATVAARASLAVLKVETARDKDADERAQRAQADLVAAWLVNDEFTDEWHVRVANESKVPIYDVEVAITSTLDDNMTLFHSALIPPGGESTPFPNLITRIVDGDPDQVDSLGDPSNVILVHDVEITFRDAAGRRWSRSSTGRLTSFPPDEV